MKVAGAGAVAFAVLLLATPAWGSSETPVEIHNAGTGKCVDSNVNKRVYANACGAGNNFQRWTFSVGETGSNVRNFATNYCLDSNAAGVVYTNPCSGGNTYQNWFWVNLSGASGQFKNVATGKCLTVGSAGGISSSSCNSSDGFQRFSNES